MHPEPRCRRTEMPIDGDPLANGAVKNHSPRARAADSLNIVAPIHRDVARWLLNHELRNGGGEKEDLAGAVERICMQFFNRLARVTSLPACQALLSRALHIPRADFAFLAGVRAGSSSAPLMEGLRASVDGVDGAYARAGLEAVIGTLIDLLASFIGHDLTLNMVREVWPGLPAFELPAALPPAEPTVGGSEL